MLKPNQLYVCPNLVTHWVATDADGRPWMFPAENRGWDSRREYHGHRGALVEVDNLNAVATGWLSPRKCHGCDRELEPGAGLSVIFCGRCGDVQ